MGISQTCRAGGEDKAKFWPWLYTDKSLAGGTDPVTEANARLAARWIRHDGQRTHQAQA